MGRDQNNDRDGASAASSGTADPFEHIEQSEDLEQALAKLAVEQPRLARIVECRRAGRTLSAVGAALGISRERVRQLEVRAYVWLRKELGLEPPRVKRRRHVVRDPSPMMQAILDYLREHGCSRRSDIAAALNNFEVSGPLARLRERGLVRSPRRGWWELNEDESEGNDDLRRSE